MNIEKQYKIGEIVFLKIFPTHKGIDLPRHDGPYKIVNIKGDWCYVLENCRTGQILERNHYHVKKYKGELAVGSNGGGKKKKIRTPTSIWSASKDTDTRICNNNVNNPKSLQVTSQSCEERKPPTDLLDDQQESANNRTDTVININD